METLVLVVIDVDIVFGRGHFSRRLVLPLQTLVVLFLFYVPFVVRLTFDDILLVPSPCFP